MKLSILFGATVLVIISMAMKNVSPIGLHNDDTIETIEVMFE